MSGSYSRLLNGIRSEAATGSHRLITSRKISSNSDNFQIPIPILHGDVAFGCVNGTIDAGFTAKINSIM